jgi:hypothetical protein
MIVLIAAYRVVIFPEQLKDFVNCQAACSGGRCRSGRSSRPTSKRLASFIQRPCLAVLTPAIAAATPASAPTCHASKPAKGTPKVMGEMNNRPTNKPAAAAMRSRVDISLLMFIIPPNLRPRFDRSTHHRHPSAFLRLGQRESLSLVCHRSPTCRADRSRSVSTNDARAGQ